MPKHVIKIGQRYVEWSTVVDAPTAVYRSIDEVISDAGLTPDRLGILIARGSTTGESPRRMVAFNRAGPGESAASFDELVVMVEGQIK